MEVFAVIVSLGALVIASIAAFFRKDHSPAIDDLSSSIDHAVKNEHAMWMLWYRNWRDANIPVAVHSELLRLERACEDAYGMAWFQHYFDKLMKEATIKASEAFKW